MASTISVRTKIGFNFGIDMGYFRGILMLSNAKFLWRLALWSSKANVMESCPSPHRGVLTACPQQDRLAVNYTKPIN